MGTLVLKTIAGILAGLLAWLVMEPSAPANFGDPGWAGWSTTFVVVLSLAVGAAVSGVNGWLQGSKQHFLVGLTLGIFFGAIGGTFGTGMGAALGNLFGGGQALESGTLIERIPVRLLSLLPIGLFLGFGIGLSSLSFRRGIQGALGGAIGGAIAGLSFDPIGEVLSRVILASRGQQAGEVGGPSRAAFAILLGGSIALFIGIADRVFRSAWVRQSLGRNEGKEWSIDRQQTSIGRSEGAGIPIFSDPEIAPVHAYIVKQGDGYLLADAGSPQGTYLEGQRITQAPLQSGAMFHVGQTQLQFLLKAGVAARQPLDHGYRPPMPHAGPQVAPPQPQMWPPNQGVAPAYNPSAGPMSQATQMQMQAPTPILVVLDGPLAGQRYGIGQGIILGRESTHVPMGYDTVASRNHAALHLGPNGILVQDQGSTNGTFLNGQRVTSGEARPGDVLRVGQTSFRVDLG